MSDTDHDDPEPCPDCAAGKCSGCDGHTWDNRADALTDCPCDHGRTT